MTGRPKYGFKKINEKLIEDKEQQEVIQTMIGMKADGSTYAEIANYLNDQKIPAIKKNTDWTKRKVEHVLSSFKYEITKKEDDDLEELLASLNDGKSKTIKPQLPFEDKTRCGSVFEWEWLSDLPDGRYILEGYEFEKDDDNKLISFYKNYRKKISADRATELVVQFKKEHDEIRRMLKRYEERKRREPYKFRDGTQIISQTARDRVKNAEEVFEGWVDVMNKPKISNPATTKRKIRQIGRHLISVLTEQIQWHLHLAQEVERLHSRNYFLEKELSKFESENEIN